MAVPLFALAPGLNVSRLCLGTMTFGEQNSMKESFNLLQEAFNSGVNFFDSAEMYPVPQRSETQGRSEEYIGLWIRERKISRDRVVLATKVTGPSGQMTWIRGGPNCLDAFNITEAINNRQRPPGSPPRPPRHLYVTTWQDDKYILDFEEEQRPQPRRKCKGTDIEALAKAIAEQPHDVHLKVPEFDGKSDAGAFIEWLDKCSTARRTSGYCPITEWWKMLRVERKVYPHELCLLRLRTDYIDLYQVHWPDRYVPMFGETDYDPTRQFCAVSIQEQLEALGRAVDAGKIRYIGLSNETPYGLMKFVQFGTDVSCNPKIVSLQLVALNVAIIYGISLLAYSPLAMGLLTGKYFSLRGGPWDARMNLFRGKYSEEESRYNLSSTIIKAATKVCSFFRLVKQNFNWGRNISSLQQQMGNDYSTLSLSNEVLRILCSHRCVVEVGIVIGPTGGSFDFEKP
ncbi:hypothetical protein GIB67_006773 [Kingdonia uniflora]|uniref:NADP-dependent oxidoreductase domain-containing protein n=1 Tax=Kingdonia uniflora TaxID=39325 RepID=A0A7J7KZT2_9MAGN|nr:hypothetical protein GIB67_006773 [Kingdonia uniflora]